MHYNDYNDLELWLKYSDTIDIKWWGHINRSLYCLNYTLMKYTGGKSDHMDKRITYITFI